MSKGTPAVGEVMPGGDPAITAAEDISFDAAVMMGEDGFHSLVDSLLRYRSRESDRWSYRAYFGIHKLPGARLRVLRSLAPDL